MGEKANRRNTWKKAQVFVFVCGAWMQPQVTIACPGYPRKSEVIHWWLVLPPFRVDELLLLVTRYVAGDAARWCSRTGCQFGFPCKLFGSQQCASFRLGSSQQQMQSPALRPSLFCFLCCVNSWKSVCFARHGVDTDTEPNSEPTIARLNGSGLWLQLTRPMLFCCFLMPESNTDGLAVPELHAWHFKTHVKTLFGWVRMGLQEQWGWVRATRTCGREDQCSAG